MSLPSRQRDILGVVAQCAPVTASEIGQYHLPIGYGSAYSGLQALERKGLVSATYTTGKSGRAYGPTRAGRELADQEFSDNDAEWG